MFDFHSAFLNGKLGDDEIVYMEQPYSYEEQDRQKYCLQLIKTIYGLKQAGRCWYDKVCKLMNTSGLHKSQYDLAVFYGHNNGKIVLIAIQVDDCTITGESQALLNNHKEMFKMRFALMDLG